MHPVHGVVLCAADTSFGGPHAGGGEGVRWGRRRRHERRRTGNV